MIGAHPPPSNNSLAHLHRSRQGRTHYSSTITVGTTQSARNRRSTLCSRPLPPPPPPPPSLIPCLFPSSLPVLCFFSLTRNAQEKEEKKKKVKPGASQGKGKKTENEMLKQNTIIPLPHHPPLSPPPRDGVKKQNSGSATWYCNLCEIS